MSDDALAFHILVLMAFIAGVVFGMILDAWLLPFIVQTRNRQLRRGR